MQETLATFLKYRAERSYAYLLQQIESLTEAEALAGSRPDWLDHRWGIGQNGSIAGIVYHVAAWKQMTLPLFSPEGKPMSREEFEPDLAPALDDWQGIQAWLKQVGMAWNVSLAELPAEEFDATRTWDTTTLTVAKFVVEIYEHDIQHAAQIEYLRQQWKATHTIPA